MDKVCLDIISSSFTISALFAVFFRYYHKNLSSSYWGDNPHKIKSEIIDSYTNRVFLLFAGIGALIQLVSIIEADGCEIKNRSYSTDFYWSVTLCTLILIALSLWQSVNLSKRLAQKKWMPLLSNKYYRNLPQLNFWIKNENKFSNDYIQANNITDENVDAKRANIDLKEISKDLIDLFEMSDKKLNDQQKIEIISNLIEKHFTASDED